MNYLAIDTSGKNLSIVVCNEGKIFSFFEDNCGVKHSDKIMVEIENLIEKANYDIKKSDFIACVVGAGSFTGIRIGVATVKALCFAYSLPALSVTSFDTLAYNEKSGKVLAVIDAGHDGFYVCGYNDKRVQIEPCYIMKEQLFELEKTYKMVASTDIDGINVKKVSVLGGLVNAVDILKNNKDDNLDNLSPLYVRKSQAEEGIFSPIKLEDAEFLASAKEKGFNDAWNLEMILSSFKTGNFCGFIASNGEKKIGFITLNKITPEAEIETVFVCEEYRRKGVGKLLIEKAFEYLRKEGVNKLFLEVRKSNANAISLYEKSGFKVISERKKYYLDGEDAIIYLKEL